MKRVFWDKNFVEQRFLKRSNHYYLFVKESSGASFGHASNFVKRTGNLWHETARK